MTQHETPDSAAQPQARASDALSDEDIAARASSEPAALAMLYDRYADRVYRYLLARTGDVVLADDVTGEALAYALARVGRFDPTREPFATWLFRIVAQRMDDYRRGRLRPPRVSDEQRREAFAMAQQPPIPELLEGLSRLPTGERETIALLCIAELSPVETARLFGLPEEEIPPRLREALGALAFAMEYGHES